MLEDDGDLLNAQSQVRGDFVEHVLVITSSDMHVAIALASTQKPLSRATTTL